MLPGSSCSFVVDGSASRESGFTPLSAPAPRLISPPGARSTPPWLMVEAETFSVPPADNGKPGVGSLGGAWMFTTPATGSPTLFSWSAAITLNVVAVGG